MSHKIRVGVLRGGLNHEYDNSLTTGGAVISHLMQAFPHKYKIVDLLITEDGTWHMNGVPATLEKIHQNVDVVFNALHGYYGEDGKVQQILEHFKIPYTGSGIVPSAVGMNKILTKEYLAEHGFKTPRHEKIVCPIGEFSERELKEFAHTEAHRIFGEFPAPWILKPVSGSSSFGIILARTFTELEDAIFNLVSMGDDSMVEEFIKGREAVGGVVENFRGQSLYSFLPIEIKKDATNPIGRLSKEESGHLQELAKTAHEKIGFRHYSYSDFIIHPEKGVYMLEANSHPKMGGDSLLPHFLDAVGATVPEFLDHVISLALENKKDSK